MQNLRVKVTKKTSEMQNAIIRVQFNTSSRGINSSLRELRRRCRQSPGFYRLLKLAAYRTLRGEPVDLGASNPKAERALRLAVAGISRSEYQTPMLGKSFRVVYERRDGKEWLEVSKATADAERAHTTTDSLAIREVIAYSSKITWTHAEMLERKTRPQIIHYAPEWSEYRENREAESAHSNPLNEEHLSYNDAGKLETPEERAERIAQTAKAPRVETWLDAELPLSYFLKATPAPRPEPRRIELPAAPFYYSSTDKIKGAAAIMHDGESEARRLNRLELDTDDAEVKAHAEMDEFLAEENLEEGMITPAQALARAGF